MAKVTRDAMNPYTPTKANDVAEELVALVMNFYRTHRGQFTSTEATNVGDAVTKILNETYKV